jgi:hypothetical protein
MDDQDDPDIVKVKLLNLIRLNWPKRQTSIILTTTTTTKKANRQTHTQETTKLTEENSTGKTQMETCSV